MLLFYPLSICVSRVHTQIDVLIHFEPSMTAPKALSILIAQMDQMLQSSEAHDG